MSRAANRGASAAKPSFEASFFDYVRVDGGRIIERVQQADVLAQLRSSTARPWAWLASMRCSCGSDTRDRTSDPRDTGTVAWPLVPAVLPQPPRLPVLPHYRGGSGFRGGKGQR